MYGEYRNLIGHIARQTHIETRYSEPESKVELPWTVGARELFRLSP